MSTNGPTLTGDDLANIAGQLWGDKGVPWEDTLTGVQREYQQLVSTWSARRRQMERKRYKKLDKEIASMTLEQQAGKGDFIVQKMYKHNFLNTFLPYARALLDQCRPQNPGSGYVANLAFAIVKIRDYDGVKFTEECDELVELLDAQRVKYMVRN